jgi:hypothetical protein
MNSFASCDLTSRPTYSKTVFWQTLSQKNLISNKLHAHCLRSNPLINMNAEHTVGGDLDHKAEITTSFAVICQQLRNYHEYV